MMTETTPTLPGAGAPTARRRILLVDDHILVRQGLSLLLAEESDMEVVGEAGDGEEGVKLARCLLPDVIVLDFSMPRMDGLQATRILRREFPEVRIVALSMYEKADRAEAMLAAGANAYVEKNGRAEQLLEAIRGG